MAIGHLPTAPPFLLHRHQIAQVLCQVQFSPVLGLREEEAAAPFQERIRRSYPRYSRTAALAMVVGPQGLQSQQEGPALHRFESADGFGITLAPEFLALEARSYERFDDFADRLAQLLTHVSEVYEPPEMNRVGLRFVNELRLSSAAPAEEALRAITPELLGINASDALAQSVTRSEQVVELAVGDGDGMYVRHGLFPGGTTIQAPFEEPDPAVLAQPFYLLDIDAFRVEPLPFDAHVAKERALAFNDYVRTFFAWAVDESYRHEVLGQEDHT